MEAEAELAVLHLVLNPCCHKYKFCDIFSPITTNPTPLQSTNAIMSSSRVCIYVHVYVCMLDLLPADS